MTPQEAKQYLDSFINYETIRTNRAYAPSLKLERVHALLRLVGNPQKSFKIIHVAGTKGKGSTCSFAAFILQSAGYKVGLYTSPHLNDFEERIRVLDSKTFNLRDPFSGKMKKGECCKILEDIKPHIEAVRKNKKFGKLSFFEVYTTLAFCYFQRKEIDIAVLETGLGGRLDATNVADSLVCGVTPISIEHTKQLGLTLKCIATEKAAIIKNKKQIVIIAPQPRAAQDVIKKQCHRFSAKSYFINRDIRYKILECNAKGQIFDIHGLAGTYKDLKTKLLGHHQVINAAVAVGMVEALNKFGVEVSEKAIRKGLLRTRWPGRFEIIKKNPFIVLDGAHNPGSCKILVKAVKDIFPKEKVILVLGVSHDKDIRGICYELNKIVQKVIFTKADNPRAFDFTKMNIRELFPHKKIMISNNIKDGLSLARKQAMKSDVILIAGSLYIVGEVRGLCTSRI